MNEKNEYERLLTKLINAQNNINTCISELDNAMSLSNDAISINGSAYKRSQIEEKRNTLKIFRDSLVNTYIPYVKRKIMEVSE